MAPVIWGLDLGEVKWAKFKSSYMWNTTYHLRRTKFIVYQCAMIFCVVSESLGTAALSDYIDQQNLVSRLDSRATVHNNDYIGAASYNIFAGVFVATIFGAAFFFDLFWPERTESAAVRLAWKICSVLAIFFVGASAFELTVITATHSAFVSGVDVSRGEDLAGEFQKDGGAPLKYRKNARAVAAVVFLWPGFLFTIWSCVLMFKSINHDQKLGPKSTHARGSGELEMAMPQGNHDSVTEKAMDDKV